MFCPKCGTENSEGSRFCAQCGEALPVAASPVQPATGSGSVDGSNIGNVNAGSSNTGSGNTGYGSINPGISSGISNGSINTANNGGIGSAGYGSINTGAAGSTVYGSVNAGESFGTSGGSNNNVGNNNGGSNNGGYNTADSNGASQMPVVIPTAGPGTGSTPKQQGGGDIFLQLLKIVPIVVAVLYAIFAVRTLGGIFGGLGMMVNRYVVYGLFRIIAGVLIMVSRVLMVAALLLFAFCRSDERGNTESLLIVLASCGLLRVLLQIVAEICYTIGWASTRYGYIRFDFLSVGKALLLALLAVGIQVGLVYASGRRPFIGRKTDDLMNMVREIPTMLGEEMEILNQERAKKASQAHVGNTGSTTGAATGGAAMGGAAMGGAAAGAGAGNGTAGAGFMNEKRSYLMFLLLSIVTCDIYALYVVYTFARDVNIMCKEDGENTPGLLKLILLSLVTCGIYSYVWYFKMLRRVENQQKRWGVSTQSLGGMELCSCYIVLKLVGIVISFCGVGLVLSCYADYLIFRNLNLLSVEYNARLRNMNQG